MAAPRSRCGHYIFALWFLLFYSSPNLSGRRLDVYHTSTHGVALVRIKDAGPKRAARGSLKIQDAKIAKKCHLGTIAQICPAISSQLRHISTVGKKLVKQQYLSHTSSQYGELGELAAEIGSLVWGTLANFKGFWVFAALGPYCSDVAHRRPTNLCTIFDRLLGWYTVYTFWGLLPPDRILPCAKFTLRPSLAFAYWQR